eukprot:486046_1
MITDPKVIARLSSICVASATNIILLCIVLFQISYAKKQKLSLCIQVAISYLIFAIITPVYNVVYRFIITTEWCFVSDTIEEILVVFTRLILLIFYVMRLKKVFQGTGLAVNPKILNAMGICMVIYSVIVPLIWISQQQVTPKVIDGFGVYCSNIGPMNVIIIYYMLDFIFTSLLTLIFVYKLYIISKKLDVTNDCCDDYKKVIKKTIILTFISISSTWIIMYPSYLEPSDFLNEFRWFYPMDYAMNGLCVFFMFQWSISCNCCGKQKILRNQSSIEVAIR